MAPIKTTNFELFDIVCNGNEEEKKETKLVELEGWVKTNRDNGSIGFIEFNDGTCFKSVQLVYNKEAKGYETLVALRTGAAIRVVGEVVLTPENKQPFEIHVKECELEGDVADDYPLQKKRHSFEFLREIAHIRPRANTFQAVYRVRSVLSMAIHEFFQERGFIYVHTPLITTNDGDASYSSPTGRTLMWKAASPWRLWTTASSSVATSSTCRHSAHPASKPCSGASPT